jgi:hypothetical protein
MDLHISIIIPARNDAKALRLTLDHLARLRADKADVYCPRLAGLALGF